MKSSDRPRTTDVVGAPSTNLTNLRALISRIKRDSGDRMSFRDAALFAEMMIGRELRKCAAELERECAG